MTKEEIEAELKEKQEQLKQLRIKASPINTQIYLLECDIYALEEDKKLLQQKSS
ncbi:hypothetical protein J2N67_006630 (plasmid) [Bacillus thuringiensis]|uniref:hypothetical protein n=1 Tax=Bacillus cereus group TaxID=86661 RepID=UPI0015D48D41|nr:MULTISPECIES: hypothetical protein [Bacillus cereus group]USP56381.1 hypothetical protein J2N67_006630 [Bacillus thuringiensis]